MNNTPEVSSSTRPLIFTPDNEPYLGRTLLYHFDQCICSAMEQNSQTAPWTHDRTLTDHQRMACLVLPQALNIALSMRELVRQGYLFGAHVLLRSLVERAMILLYLHYYPKDIEIWNRGWHATEAPGLAKMFEAIQKQSGNPSNIPGREFTKAMNSLLHSKPDSAPWSLIPIEGERIGHAPSKMLDRPDLCDDLCGDTIPWLVVVQAMMPAYFPEAPSLKIEKQE